MLIYSTYDHYSFLRNTFYKNYMQYNLSYEMLTYLVFLYFKSSPTFFGKLTVLFAIFLEEEKKEGRRELLGHVSSFCIFFWEKTYMWTWKTLMTQKEEEAKHRKITFFNIWY